MAFSIMTPETRLLCSPNVGSEKGCFFYKSNPQYDRLKLLLQSGKSEIS